MEVLEKTTSICPACYQDGVIQSIAADIVEEDGKVWITKQCEKHGAFKDIFFGDVNLYRKWAQYTVTGTDSPDVKTAVLGYPALYEIHKSQSVLTNLLITNRCDLRCSYCFMNADRKSVV